MADAAAHTASTEAAAESAAVGDAQKSDAATDKQVVAEISLAPMMKITTPEFRLLISKLAPDTVLFTEMIVATAVVHMSEERLVRALGRPRPLTVVQLGGSAPAELAEAVAVLQRLGWREFNLNCGCPSERVQHGKFGAVLMLEPALVAEIVRTVHAVTGAVLSLKIRTGVDEHDTYEFLHAFVSEIVQNSPCRRVYVHARRCWLRGVSPKHNRNVPPLNYAAVHRLKEDFPGLFVGLNGGLKGDALAKLGGLDGAMIGRHAWDDPNVFNSIRGRPRAPASAVRAYLEESLQGDFAHTRVLLPLVNLRRGRGGCKALRQAIDRLVKAKASPAEIMASLETFLEE